MNLRGQWQLLAYLQKRTIGFGYILEDTLAGMYADAAVTQRLARAHRNVHVSTEMYHRVVQVAACAIQRAAGATPEHEARLVQVLDCLKTNMDTPYARAGVIDQ